MKLNENFLTQEIDDTQVMVATGEATFAGLVRSNATAAFIVDCLKADTTKEAIVEAMLAKYDAAKDVIEADVDKILNKLRSIGALDE
jgi:hypothetical protein